MKKYRGKGKASLTERFWKKIAKAGPDNCWLWMGTKSSQGYGQLRIDGKVLKAHRFIFALTNPLDPENLVLHKCDVKACCNPRHLYAGTHSDNLRDAYARGLKISPRGEKAYHAKMTQTKADEICRLVETGLSQRTIARDLGISKGTIWWIMKRDRWARA